MSDQDETVYHVLTRGGDGRPEVDAALERLQARGVSREASGFHKQMYVTRADQTVLMVASRESPLSAELRHQPGWREPGDRALQ
ncbi:MAG TPA: hypothetical protein VNP72_00355 [Longimicrobium sp.]|nr:hypothetical protein [Longimicrobium sp.]